MSFRTRRGRCSLDDATLRLESSLRGQLRRYYEGSRLLLVVYVLLFVVLGWQLLFVARRAVLLGLGLGGLLVAGSYPLNRLRGFTTTDEIPLDDVVQVTARPGTKGLTRPRFVVVYESDGERRRRYVMMPSLFLSYGDEEFETAIETFRSAGIPVEAA